MVWKVGRHTLKSASIASLLSSNGGFPATLAGLNKTHSSEPKDSISFRVAFSCFKSEMSQAQVLTRQL
jgi:hypothetical protein